MRTLITPPRGIEGVVRIPTQGRVPLVSDERYTTEVRFNRERLALAATVAPPRLRAVVTTKG